LYFITICVKNRDSVFGEIVDCRMNLNETGKIAGEFWLCIPEHFPNVELHEYIIMPNHIHGIIELLHINPGTVGTRHVVSLPDISKNTIRTRHVVSVQSHVQSKFSKPIPGSVSVIVQQYKASVTRFVKKNNISNFKWQPRFYEHIIRDQQSFDRISQYIINNPENWKKDDYFDCG
jgi:REP element-mobilizing transposase RayT